MASTSVVAPRLLEDPLAHLPVSNILEFRKGQTVFDQTQPAAGLYLIIEGKVKAFSLADNGQRVIFDIYQTDDFFGEGALLHSTQNGGQAVALEHTRLMTWTVAEIEDIVPKRPKLAVALLQMLVRRNMEFRERIESFSTDNIARRLARSLIRFSERLGTPATDGSLQMAALTHELLSEYVGTSREIITHYMNEFRRHGFLNYSRKGITVYPAAFKEWLRQAN
jgi:CRP-like cAMP-binding protein